MKSKLQNIEALIREGRLSDAKRELLHLTLRKDQRDALPFFASLSRRLGLARLGLKKLSAVVRSDKPNAGSATPQEKIEYAACLRSEGAVSEAEEILSSIDGKKYPQASFQLALCLVSQWNYAASIPYLYSYLRAYSGPDYAKYVAQINLLAALTHEGRAREANELLNELQLNLRAPNFSLLYQRSHELGAQLAIEERNWNRADTHLHAAAALLRGAQGTIYTLYLRKWAAVVDSLRNNKVSPEMVIIRKEAAQQRAWEIVRDCDYYIGQITRDPAVLSYLYFGTPFESYRKKLRELIIDLPESFHWQGDRNGNLTFDLTQAQAFEAGKEISVQLNAGQALHRFLIILCQDFYKPIPALAVFSKLFPGEKFNPVTSPNRVHHISSRFQKWTDYHSLPLELVASHGEYRLELTGRLAISIPKDPLPLDCHELQFLRLKSSLPQLPFTAGEAIKTLESSRSSVQRLLQWAVNEGKLQREGQTDRTRYKIVA